MIRNIRDLVGSHAGTNDVDVFLQKPVSIGHGVQVMGVNVAMNNTHDDRLILRNVDNSDLYYSDYRYYDGGLHDGVKTYNTLNSKQLSAVCKELQAMEQRHTLFPVQRTYMYSDAAIIPGVSVDKQTLLKTKRNPSIDSISVYSGDLTLVRKENTGLSNVDKRLDKMFDRAVLRAVESLMSRNGVVREFNPLTLKYNYAVILDTYSKSNLDAGEETLKKTGGDDLKSLEIIAKAYDGDAVVYREGNKIAKVTFSDLQAANQFVSSYYRREKEAISAVKKAVKQGDWSELGKAYVNAFIVEHGGIDKPTREVAANSLIKASDILNISSLHKDSIKSDLMALAQTIPVVACCSSEAKDNDYDDAVYFAAENLAALQQRPDIGQDLRDKSSIVDIIIARMKDPVARAFTPEQAQAVRDYITQSDDVKSRLADANDLYYSAASSEEVKRISSPWKEDVKDELSDLAKGIFRDESRGFHR